MDNCLGVEDLVRSMGSEVDLVGLFGFAEFTTSDLKLSTRSAILKKNESTTFIVSYGYAP